MIVVTLHRDNGMVVVGPFDDLIAAAAYARGINDKPVYLANVRQLRSPAEVDAVMGVNLPQPVGHRRFHDPEGLLGGTEIPPWPQWRREPA